ncbi:hypothetical protein [Haladaptatus sp. DJG-WS-42]|uniref:hypothetical protein n=1 Tax=Haladaptatus sp. DJG-WS-42 TaxID=3120516 RepID=UPI0030D2D184
MARTGDTGNGLWIRWFARKTKCDRVATRLFGETTYGPFLFILLIVLLDGPLLSLVGAIQTSEVLLAENPGEWVLLLAWPFVVWLILRLETRYADTVAELPETERDLLTGPAPTRNRVLAFLGVPVSASSKAEANLDTIAPSKVKIGALTCGLLFHGSWLLFDPGAGQFVTETAGPLVATVKFYGIYPLIYYPLGAEFLALYLGIHVILPFKIRQARLFDFSDPQGFAGLEPAGELVKSTSNYFLLLVTIFAVFQTVARGTGLSNAFPTTLIVAGMGVGLVLFFAPVFWLNAYMQEAKRQKIEAIATQIRASGPDDEMFPYKKLGTPENAGEYTHRFIQLQRVEHTNEYPVDFSILQEFLLALVLPYALSKLFDIALTSV